MEIKEQVRSRVAELTRQAYERGYRDGAASALKELDQLTAADMAESPTGDRKLPKRPSAKAVAKKPAKSKSAKAAKVTSKTKTAPAKSKASKPAAKAKSTGKDRGKPKTQIIQSAIQGLLDEKGEARRDEALAKAQAENPAINKFDFGNGLRILIKQSKVRVSPEDSGLLLPAA